MFIVAHSYPKSKTEEDIINDFKNSPGSRTIFRNTSCFYPLKYKTDYKSGKVYFGMSFLPEVDVLIEELNKVFTNSKIESIVKKITSDYSPNTGNPYKANNRLIKISVSDEYENLAKKIVLYMLAVMVRYTCDFRFGEISEEHKAILVEDKDPIKYLIERNEYTKKFDSEHTLYMKGKVQENWLLTINDIEVMNTLCEDMFGDIINNDESLSVYVKQTPILDRIGAYLKGLG